MAVYMGCKMFSEDGRFVKPPGKTTGHKIVTDVPALFNFSQRKRIRQATGNYFVCHDRKYTSSARIFEI
jgi:hypothetical protein